MGFRDYAEKHSLLKDNFRIKIILDRTLTYPTLDYEGDLPKLRLPEPRISGESIEFLGYTFPKNDDGKKRTSRLFRATVTHITAHTVTEIPRLLETQSIPAEFVETLIKDVYATAKIGAEQPDRLADLAYANALATSSLKPLKRIYLPSTRIMTAILANFFGGKPLDELDKVEAELVEDIAERLRDLKSIISSSLGEEEDCFERLRETAEWIYDQLAEKGPFVELPAFPYTENASTSSVYSRTSTPDDTEVEPFFKDAMRALGKPLPEDGKMSSTWVRSEDVAGVQVFSNSKIEKDKEVKILARMREGLADTRFRSIEMPPEDYHEYLKAKDIVGGSSRRLLNNIMQASNLEFEDIRKKYGVLDLSDAVQVVASKSDRSDVFLRDELMKQSFALVVLIDVSRSMGTAERENRARAICVADAVATFVTESSSCAIYGFSDRLYVLKDGSESFSKSVRARIGGVPFEGTTYMPDALKVAAEFLKSKVEEQRIILVISDGYPYGYEGIYEALEENTLTYMGGGMILIGIGVDTERMGEHFRYSAGVYSQKDLINNVARIFLKASMSELG